MYKGNNWTATLHRAKSSAQEVFFILTVQMKLEKLNEGKILTSLGSPVGPLQTGGEKKERSHTFLCIRI